MSRKNLAALGCAALVGAALAFHAGVIFGGRNAIRQNGGSEARSDNAPPKSHLRNVYSPQINNDPYVQDHWQKVVETLEAQCREAGEHCTEAKAARRWLNDQR